MKPTPTTTGHIDTRQRPYITMSDGSIRHAVVDPAGGVHIAHKRFRSKKERIRSHRRPQ